MQQHDVDVGGRTLIWALVNAFDVHGVLSSGMIASAIDEMSRIAEKHREAGDEQSFQRISDVIGQLASYATKRNEKPNVSADIHLRSFS